MNSIMAERKRKPKKPAKRSPSRDTYTYVYIPNELAEKLKVIADQQDRSLSYMAKKAVEHFIESQPPQV